MEDYMDDNNLINVLFNNKGINSKKKVLEFNLYYGLG